MVFLAALTGQVAAPQPVEPFESDTWTIPPNAVDEAVLGTLHKLGVEPPNPCSDEVFVRRVYLDVIGTLPTPEEVQAFLDDTRADKRAALIEALMVRGEFADYWALKWGDLLRVKSEFPINLWPNAVQAYHHWIRDAVRDDMPYDQFARALLTSSGSNFRVPPVNFYRAIQGRDSTTIAQAVALTFMGVRTDGWPQDRRDQMTAIFSRVAYKQTGEWKEEIVYLDPAAEGPLNVVFPDGTTAQVPADQDPREAFADWLITPDNPWFARNLANRAWAWLMGHGVIHEPDDIRPDNPPASPELLTCLEQELVNSRYDLRALFRLILNSRTYQGSSIPQGDAANSGALFAHYTVRQLDAEVLADALTWLGGPGESYSSPIPEPFTFIPEDQRTIALADGSITSAFLEMFGRPARDTGLESERDNHPTDAQRLYLLNSAEVGRRITQSKLLLKLVATAKGNRAALIDSVYVAVLSRHPAQAEAETADAYFQTDGLSFKQGTEDLAWALINTKEFLYRH